MQDTSGPEGRWHLKNWYFHSHDPFTLIPLSVDIRLQSSHGSSYGGQSINEQGCDENIDEIRWQEDTRLLSFRRQGSNHIGRSSFWEWYRGRIVEGIFVGRFSHSDSSPDKPLQNSIYINHVAGWNAMYIDRDIVPRVYKVILSADYRGLSGIYCLGLLRIDRNRDDLQYAGRMKIHATGRENGWNIGGEELEYDLTINHWDGKTIKFLREDTRPDQNWSEIFTGTVDDQKITGTFTHEPGAFGPFCWSGTRAELLHYGFIEKDATYRKNWQQRTRRQLMYLMMAGNPEPSKELVSVSPRLVRPRDRGLVKRDDNPQRWPHNYVLREIHFEYTLDDVYGGPEIIRRSHCWLATPNRVEYSTKKYPAVLALNGHYGSAWDVLQPNSTHSCGDLYWYGDSFARRGFVVLAVDISHRKDSPIYGPMSPLFGPFILDFGDDPIHGNVAHNSITSCGFESSDWEETGERVWDTMRALDYLLSLPYVDTSCVLATGLSMGAEIATIVGALDPRISIVIPSGWSPDTGVFNLAGHKCSNWIHADNLEYIDTSDYHALIAPRPIIVQTGKQDHVWSITDPYFAADKGVARRSRAAYGENKDRFVHYLHHDQHEYHTGDYSANASDNSQPNIRIPVVTEPELKGSLSWQTDPKTEDLKYTLFDCVELMRNKAS